MTTSVPRPILGLIAAPLASALVHGVYVQDIAAAFPALFIAAAGCLCLGLPSVALLSRFGRVSAWRVALAGVCAGVVAAVFLFIYITMAQGESVSSVLARHLLTLFAMHGAIVATVYWIVVLRSA